MGQTTFEFGTETIEPEEPQVEHPKSEKKEAKKKVTAKETKAHQLAKEQRDIPVSEFFEQNRHILGFDNPTHSLITAVKEGVDNSLDACEQAGILPELKIELGILARDELSIVNDQFGAPTSARAISCSLLDILAAADFNSSDCPWGTYHLQSEPGVSWFDFAAEIFKQARELGLINKTMKLNPIASSEFPTPVKRPANSKLDGTKLQQNFAIAPVQWQDDLQQLLKQMSAITS